MDILITGGFGNLGSWLTRALLAGGHAVTVLARGPSPIPELVAAIPLCVDITNSSAMKSALQGRSFDAVVHTASYNENTDPDYYWKSFRVNAEGTRILLQHLELKSIKNFIYFSTFHVYGAASGRITEETPPLPRNDYANSHLAAEWIVKQFHANYGLPYTILRLTNSYGCPVSRNSTKWNLVFNDLARMAAVQSSIRLSSDGRPCRDFIWMGDVCRVVEDMLTRQNVSNRVFNLSFGRSISLFELATIVRDAFTEYSGKVLSIETAARAQDAVDPSLEVISNGLWESFDWRPEHRLRDEALKVFALVDPQMNP